MAENGHISGDGRTMALVQAETILMEVYNSLDEGRSALEAACLGKSICIEHCGKCCEQTTPIASELEVSEIISTIGVNPKFRKIMARALDWLSHQHTNIDSEIRDTRHLQGEFYKLLRSQCPFLDPDKRCAIYESRPLMCRSYGVTVPADDFCKAPAGNMRWSTPGYLVTGDHPIGQDIDSLSRELVSFTSKGVPDQIANGFLPTMLVRRMAFKQFNYLVNHGKVQKPKLIIGAGLAKLMYAPSAVEDIHQTEEQRELAELRPRPIYSGEYDQPGPGDSTPRFLLQNHSV